MKKNIKALLCCTALVGAMSAGLVFAEDVIINAGDNYTFDTNKSFNNGYVANSGTAIVNENVKLDALSNFANAGNLGTAVGSTINSTVMFNGNENTSSSQITNTGNISITDYIINYGIVDNSGSIETTAIVNENRITNDNTLTANSQITNNGTIENTQEVNTQTIINTNTINNKTADSALNANTIINNSGEITNAGTIEVKDNIANNGTINNQGNLNAANSIDNSNTIANNKTMTTGSLTNNTTGKITNAGSITADNSIRNSGTIENSGSINAKEFIINSNIITNTDVNSQIETGSLVNEQNGSITNQGNITANNAITNNGIITNSGQIAAEYYLENNGNINNGGNMYAGTLVNNLSIKNDSNITVNIIHNNNNSDINGAGSLTVANGGDIEAGSTITQGILEFTGGNITNNGDINVAEKFTNGAAITGSGNIIANGGSSSASISQNNITLGGKFENNSSMTSTGTFTNTSELSGNGTLTVNNGANSNSIEQSGMTINGTFDNGGTIDISGTFENKGTFSSSNSLTADTITNNGTLNNSGSVLANSINNNAGNVINNQGTIGSEANRVNITNNGSIVNGSGTIYADKLINKDSINNSDTIIANTIDNQTSGSISGVGSLTVSNGGTNAGTITQNIVEFTGGKIDNSGNINAAETFTNNAEITGSGNLLANGGSSSALISQNDITLSGSFENNSSMTSNGTFTNTANITGGKKSSLTVTNGASSGNITQNSMNVKGNFGNSGEISTVDFTNEAGANLGNYNKITTSGNFKNDGTIAGDTGSINIENGTGINNGTIIQKSISVAKDTVFTNEVQKEITVETLSNNGTVLNKGTFNLGDTLTNDATFINSGKDAAISSNTVVNNGVFGLENGANISLQAINNDVNAAIYALGKDNRLDAGTGGIQQGNFVVGDGQTETSLTFVQGSVLEQAHVNVAQNAVLNVGEADKAASVIFNDNETDKWNGTVNLVNGEVTLDNFKQSTNDTASYTQSGGTLTLQKDSSLSVDNSALIQGGNIIIDNTSAFISRGTAGEDILYVSNLTNQGMFSSMNSDWEIFGADTLDISGTTADSPAKFTIDVFARSNAEEENALDQFIGTNLTDGHIEISDWNLGTDIFGWHAPIDRDITLENIFEYDNVGDVSLSITKKEVFTPIGWYQLNNKGGINGLTTLNLTRFNPQVYRAQMTTLAQWQNQLAIDDMLFTHSFVLPSFKEEDGGVAYSGMMANRYASTDPLFAPYQYSRKDGGLWYKMYGTFENLQMNNGLGKVGNNAYGSLIGADFGLKELKNGWKFMPTAYIGYNGAHQTYAGLGAYQNGGQAGFLGTWYKNNFILGALAYGGVYQNSIDIAGHTDNTFNYFAGAATKAAYNWRFHKDWVLQPNLFLSYNFFGQQNFHSDFGQMGMMSGILNGVNLAPGLNLIWEKETFSIYATLQYMYNLNGAVGGRAGNVGLPHLQMERGYIQYGLGFTKRFTDRFSGYLQAVLRNAGRTGVGFQLGFNWMLGK